MAYREAAFKDFWADPSIFQTNHQGLCRGWDWHKITESILWRSVMTDSSTAKAKIRCAAALSTQSDTAAALAEVCRQAMDRLSASVDLAVVFVSQHHASRMAQIAESLCKYLGTEHLIGCTGESIAGDDREVEEGPAISLWLASLPGTRVTPMRLDFERTPDGGLFTGWLERSNAAAPNSIVLLLGEPYSFPADAFLERLLDDEAGLPVLGGMASGAHEPGDNKLILGPHELDRGAVAVRLEGDCRIRSVVSQGCRPVGKPLVVTKADRNLIVALGGKSPLEQFQQIYKELPTSEQALVQKGLHVGIVTNEYQDEFSRGDFLVRNVVGADPETGAIGIGDYVRVGQTVQFHLRDAGSADEDLRELLAADQRNSKNRVAGALLFSCNGRGTRLFDEPNHDALAIRGALGDVPLAGFFAQGEIGPIGGRNFVHGFTASVAIFEEAAP
jgi:small ligand-binding sensory domain FIST